MLTERGVSVTMCVLMSVLGGEEWVHGRGAAGTAAAKGALQRVRVKNRELLLWALGDVRPCLRRNARDGQLLRARVFQECAPMSVFTWLPETS